jgi:hypothetical protein
MMRGGATRPRVSGWIGWGAGLYQVGFWARLTASGLTASGLTASSGLTACSGFGGADDVAPSAEANGLGAAGAGMAAASNPAAADWSCLGDAAAAIPSAPGTGTATYSVPVRSLFGAPVTNVSTRVCLPVDLTCATPLSEVSGLDPQGLLVVQVPVGFSGYLEVQVDAHVPTLFHMRKPVLRDMLDLQPVTPIPTAGLLQLAGLLNTEVVPELGVIALAVVDCQGSRAPGAAFSNNLGGRVFYFIDGVPNVSASATDIQGLGGFANVPTRLLEVSAQLDTNGQIIGTRTLLPRAGWINSVQVRPPALAFD